MAERSLIFTLHPEYDLLPFSLLSKSLEDVRHLIRDVDYAATRQRSGRQWRVLKLQSSAPTITLLPPPGEEEAIDIIANGLRTVTMTNAEVPPEYFSESALNDLIKMKRLFSQKDHLKRLTVSINSSGPVASIESDIPQKVEHILRSGYTEEGSLQGILEIINVHGSPTFTIWEQISGTPVRCSFPNQLAWKQRVKELLEKPVLVSGKIRFFRNGIPLSVSSIERIDDLTPNPSLRKADFGSIPDLTGDESTLDYIRRIRE